MDLKYLMSLDPKSKEYERCNDPVISVSCESIVAFNLLSRDFSPNGARVNHYVAVADLNLLQHPVIIHKGLDRPKTLLFNSDGRQLLIITVGGLVKLLKQKSGPLQEDWEVLVDVKLNNENILAAAFLHDGVKPQINLGEVKLTSTYKEKFSHAKYTASLVAPGGCGSEGIVVFTASGLLSVSVIWHPGDVETVRHVVGGIRDSYHVADIATSSDGSIHLCVWQPNIIKSWRIKLSHKYVVLATATPSNNNCDIDNYDSNRRILVDISRCESAAVSRPKEIQNDNNWFAGVDRLYFPYRDDPQVLLVVVQEKSENQEKKIKLEDGSSLLLTTQHIVQKYQLEEKTEPVFQLFAPEPSTSNPQMRKFKDWCLSGEWIAPLNIKVTSLSSPSRYLFQSSQIAHIFTIATDDGTITGVNLSTMMPVNSNNIHKLLSRYDEGGGMKREFPPSASPPTKLSLCHTWTGISQMAYDANSNLYFFNVIKNSDVGGSWPLCVVLLLEFTLVSNFGWFELLIITPGASVVTVVDKLLDNFSSHTTHLITFLQTRMNLLKVSLLRLSSSLQVKATEATLSAHLNVILMIFKQLRPVTTEISSDKCVSAMLTAYLENRSSLEQLDLDKSVDQFLFGVTQTLDCQVDPSMSKYYQPLVQYTADITMYLMVMMAQTNKNEFLRDGMVKVLREILFRSRIWYRHNKLVMPKFITKTDSVDVWSQLYKFCTRMVAILPAEPDTAFLDEILLLETQVLVRDMPTYIPPRGVLKDMLHPSSVPHRYILFTEENEEPAPIYHIGGSLSTYNQRDPLFLMQLTTRCPRLRCTRCVAERPTTHHTDNPWEQQWSKFCLCGGHWMKHPMGEEA